MLQSKLSFLVPIAFIALLRLNLTEATCGECYSAHACVGKNQFQICVNGVRDTSQNFTCESATAVCTRYGLICFEESATIKPACGDTSQCGNCADVDNFRFSCLSRTTFTQCFNDEAYGAVGTCPESYLCSVSGAASGTPCVQHCSVNEDNDICDRNADYNDGVTDVPTDTTTESSTSSTSDSTTQSSSSSTSDSTTESSSSSTSDSTTQSSSSSTSDSTTESSTSSTSDSTTESSSSSTSDSTTESSTSSTSDSTTESSTSSTSDSTTQSSSSSTSDSTTQSSSSSTSDSTTQSSSSSTSDPTTQSSSSSSTSSPTTVETTTVFAPTPTTIPTESPVGVCTSGAGRYAKTNDTVCTSYVNCYWRNDAIQSIEINCPARNPYFNARLTVCGTVKPTGLGCV